MTDEAAASRGTGRWVPIAVVATVAVALGLRLYGNRHGIPWLEEPDAEHIGLVRALERGTVGPDALLKVQRYPNLLALLLWPFAELCSGTSVVWLGRIASALFGAATVAYVFLLGRALRGPTAGLFAAAFAAVSFTGVQHAHLVKPHVAVTFFLTAALFHLTRGVESRARRDFLLAGLFGAGAAATLHTGFLVAVPVVVAAALARVGWRTLALSGALVLLALPIGHPGLFGVAADVLAGDAEASALLGAHPASMTESQGLASLKRVPIFLAETEPAVALLALLALLVGGIGRRPWMRLALPGTALFAAVAFLFGQLPAFGPRMLLPGLPALFALAGVAAASVAERRRVIAVAVVSVAVLPPAVVAARTAWLWGREDTRVLAKRWIDEHLPGDVTFASTPVLDTPLPLTPRSIAEHVDALDATTFWDDEWRRRQAAGLGDDAPRIYDVRFPFEGRWTAPPATWAPTLKEAGATVGLSYFFSTREEADPAVHAFRLLGDVVHRVEPGRARNSGAWVYRLRWPYVTLWGLERPGPVVEIVALR